MVEPSGVSVFEVVALVVVLLDVVALGFTVALSPGRGPRAALALSVALAAGVAAFVQAETPFGLGDGIVPALVGREACEAERALAERGLTWRQGHSQAVSRRPGGRGCGQLRVDRQVPPAGTRQPRGKPVIVDLGPFDLE